MAGQESEKGTWSASLESAGDVDPSAFNEKSSPRAQHTLLRASSTAIRSAQFGIGKVSSASVRLYIHVWPKVSSASVRLYDRTWPKVSSRTTSVCRRAWPKVSSASVRLYQRAWPKLSSTAGRFHQHDVPKRHDRLEITAMTLRCFQWLSALYIFLAVSGSLRSRSTFDGRVRQIQPMVMIHQT